MREKIGGEPHLVVGRLAAEGELVGRGGSASAGRLARQAAGEALGDSRPSGLFMNIRACGAVVVVARWPMLDEVLGPVEQHHRSG